MKIIGALVITFALLIPYMMFSEWMIKSGKEDQIDAWLDKWVGKIGKLLFYAARVILVAIIGFGSLFYLWGVFGIVEW